MKLHAMMAAAAAMLLVAADEPARRDLDRFQDTWVTTALTVGGEVASPALIGDIRMKFKDDAYAQMKGDETVEEGTIKIDPTRVPRTIDLAIRTGPDRATTQFGIYELAGDTLKICLSRPDVSTRPAAFESTAENQAALIVMTREKR